jgi:hypothetical protein
MSVLHKNLGEDCVEAADVNGGVMKCFHFGFYGLIPCMQEW